MKRFTYLNWGLVTTYVFLFSHHFAFASALKAETSGALTSFLFIGFGICWYCWGRFYHLRQDMETLGSELKQREEFIIIQKSDLDKAYSLADEQQKKYEEANQEVALKNQELSRRNDELTKTSNEMRQTLESLRTVQSTVVSQNLALEAANKEISLKNLQLETANQENVAQNRRMEEANEEITRKNEQFEAANILIREKNEQLLAANREIITKNEQLESAFRAISSQKEELEQANGAVLHQKEALEQANLAISQQNQILEEKNQEVLRQKKELEEAKKLVDTKNQQLQIKNEELIIRGIEIRTALEELKATQDSLIVAEKTAALLQVIANIAHEINNPIGAISAALINLQKALPDLLEHLPQVYQTLPEKETHIFNLLANRMLGAEQNLSAAEERAMRKLIEERLKEYQISQSEIIAKRLVKFGVAPEIDEFLPLLIRPDAARVIETAAALGGLQTNLNNVNSAVQRTQKTILTLKSYTDDPTLLKGGSADINKMLEDVLGFYRSPLKHRIEFATFYDTSLPPINCFPDQLAQVWISLINNAIQAVDGKGGLTITTGKDDKYVVVQIQDSGAGISQKILHRIFEPFFTTKPEGEASGLGLHLAWKIVQKHKGTIDVSSEPGNTVFTVKIPMLK